MSEKLAEVYEQYDMEILSSKKGRGATILSTSGGMRILEPFRGNITRLEQEYVLKHTLAEHGCDYVDGFILNREGQLLTWDKYRQPYVMKVHFEGRECDMHSEGDICRAISLLARFHLLGQQVLTDFNTAWDCHLEEREQKRIDEIRLAIENGEELEKLSSLYEISEEALENLMGGEENHKPASVPGKKSEERDLRRIRSVETLFNRHNQEIKKIRKFICTVKRKNAFETTFLKVYRQFYDKGTESSRLIKNISFGEGNPGIPGPYQHYGICHGTFNQHNVILGEERDALVHFERFFRGNQLQDLYQFARKAMEKNSFDFSMLEMMFQSYMNFIPLTKEDFKYIYILFSYPEKFWKIANSYYNTNKAFLSPKYVEKLETVIAQETEKERMLDEFEEKILLFN